MRKPLNWILSDTPAKKSTSRLLRSRLAATTILAVVPFLGYGRSAYAVCDFSNSPTVECSGPMAGIDITGISNLEVVTEPSSLTVTPDGVYLRGDGYIQFRDYRASSITNLYGNGLDVRAINGDGGDGQIFITTNGTVTGNATSEDDGHGIYAHNYGYGSTTIHVTGDAVITGNRNGYEFYNADGIKVIGEGTDVYISTDVNTQVRGDDNGIDAVNSGPFESEQGSLTIRADGYVAGFGYDGIYARNEGINLQITTGAQSVVLGGGHGIDALNNGSGSLTIEANGYVAGYATGDNQTTNENLLGDGIHAENSSDGTTLTITTGPGSIVRGDGDDGIDALQYGHGNLTINVYGSVTGRGDSYEDFPAYGIEAKHKGTEDATDKVLINVYGGGTVQGDTAGIGVLTFNHDIIITNAGLVRNLSGESSDLAIITDVEDIPEYYQDIHDDTTVHNNSNLIGNVWFKAEDGTDIVYNNGFWNMANGASDFGGGYDKVVNTGIFVAADDSSMSEHSRILRLERFDNDGGLISLVDGQAGDVLALTYQDAGEFDTNTGVGTFEFVGDGRLVVDAALGPTVIDPATDHLSDELLIRGATSLNDVTTVHVNVVAANGANTEGIPVVRVENNLTTEGRFVLDHPVNGGFFIWDMRLDDTKNWFELYTLTTNTGAPIIGAGALEFPQGFAATQDIWLQTIGTVLHRQADLRPLLQGLGVTPVADYSEPVEPTPVSTAIMAPGFWFKGFGAYVERDEEENGYDLDQNQTTYGGMAGFDFGTREAVGDAVLFGVFGGYIESQLKFTATNDKWNMGGPTVGAYATYLDHAFYADATVKVDFLDVDIHPDEVSADDESSTDAMNIGGRLDTGYKFGNTAFLEPQASLAVVYTEIDNVDIYGGNVEFDDDTSVRGRLGLRVGVDHVQQDATILTADVTASVWEVLAGGDSDVTIADSGFPDFGVSSDQDSTYGDVALGFSVANPDGWSTFVRGNYVFADEYEAWAGNAGVRFVW